MDLNGLSAGIKERVASELRRTTDPGAREELLIGALYEASRTVLPGLGTPKKSQEYQKALQEVSDLISCIAIPLVREGGERGVAVLSELAEGCLDPLLKKKLSVYAQELLARSGARRCRKPFPAARALGLAGALGAAAAAFYLALPVDSAQKGQPAAMALAAGGKAPAKKPPEPPKPSKPSMAPAATPGPRQAAASMDLEVLQSSQEKVQASPCPTPHPEQATKVRIVNNQILVPVVLRHGAASVQLELLLDTGATRTAVHEGVAERLPIDLRTARTGLAEVADGRTIRSKVVKLDQLSVGPFSHRFMELELIPFAGSGGTHDGLLGMDFLGKHRHQIDMEHALIRWF